MIWKRINKTLTFFILERDAIMMNKALALSKLKKSKLTAFQKRVLIETSKIPVGRTATYKQIASACGRPNAYRAVGTALRKNPFPVSIPCHRVIRGDGRLGMYSDGGEARKMYLLMREGALKKQTLK